MRAEPGPARWGCLRVWVRTAPEVSRCRSRSGQRRLGQPEQLIGLGGRGRQPIVLGTQPSDLELQGTYLRTQLGDLVEQAPVGRATYVAVEGLRHIGSLICA